MAVPLERASVMLVTDVSGSMQADRRGADPARGRPQAALDFLDGVPDEVRVGAVAFSDDPAHGRRARAATARRSRTSSRT